MPCKHNNQALSSNKCEGTPAASRTTRDHQDYISDKGYIHIYIYKDQKFMYGFKHTRIPVSEAMKMPEAKAALDKEWNKLKKMPAWGIPTSQTKGTSGTRGKKEHVGEDGRADL